MPAGRRRAVGLVIALSTQLGACQSYADPAGPMRFGNGRIDVCAPLTDAYRHMVFEQYLRIPGRGTATIEDVQPRDAQGLHVTRYLVVVDPRTASVGAVPYPPESAAWQQAEPALGAEVPRGRPVFMVADVRVDDVDGGTLAGSEIGYRVDGRSYRATGTTTLTVGRDC